jgi:hypothetical protein
MYSTPVKNNQYETYQQQPTLKLNIKSVLVLKICENIKPVYTIKFIHNYL